MSEPTAAEYSDLCKAIHLFGGAKHSDTERIANAVIQAGFRDPSEAVQKAKHDAWVEGVTAAMRAYGHPLHPDTPVLTRNPHK